MFTDINIYRINNKRIKIKQKLIFLDFRSDLEQDPDLKPGPDQLFHGNGSVSGSISKEYGSATLQV